MNLIEWGLNPKYITPEFLASQGFSETFAGRFVKYVSKGTGCWLWTGTANGERPFIGIGKFGRGSVLASRASWILHFGPIPEGLMVCHHCDVPKCVRPDHLFVGTQTDNMQDAARKGRNASQMYPGLRKGERNGNSKLTPQQIEYARQEHKGGRPYLSIAEELHVSKSCIAFICQNRTWK